MLFAGAALRLRGRRAADFQASRLGRECFRRARRYRSNAAAPRFTQAPGGSLTFSFMQAGAESHGSFRQFTTELGYDEKNPAAGSLKVTVQIASLDTQDKDRDESLAGADLFDAKKYPTAQYVANSLQSARTAASRPWANSRCAASPGTCACRCASRMPPAA